MKGEREKSVFTCEGALPGERERERARAREKESESGETGRIPFL